VALRRGGFAKLFLLEAKVRFGLRSKCRISADQACALTVRRKARLIEHKINSPHISYRTPQFTSRAAHCLCTRSQTRVR
jgi:hypothetical protein